MKSSGMWLSRRQMRWLVVLLALLPLVPTGMMVRLMIEKAERNRADAVEAETRVLRDQTIHLIERSAQSPALATVVEATADAGSGGRAGALFEHLLRIFGDEVTLSVHREDGELLAHHGGEPSDDAIVMEIQGGIFSGWWIVVDGLLRIPDEYDAQLRAAWWRAAGIVLGVVVVAWVVWFTVHRGLRVDELRSDLLTTVSHEMKTPLASMRILLETLGERGENPVLKSEAQRRDYLDLVERENRRLSRLAEDFLTFARLERGERKLRREACGVRDLVSEVVEELAPAIDVRKAEVIVGIESEIEVEGDGDALQGIVRNLVENALKYGGGEDGSAPRVLVDALVDARGRVLLRVADRGPGIPDEWKHRVFQRYFRVGSRLSDRGSGVGLGLALCRQFARGMRGRIWLESPAEGGCRFVVRLRRAGGRFSGIPAASRILPPNPAVP